MHELSVTQNLLDLSLRHAKEAGARRVTGLHITIGALSSFIDDSIEFYWEIISRGTICDGAHLNFQRTQAELMCLNCGKSYLMDAELRPCPECQSSRIKITSGDDFRLDSIDIES